MSNTVGENSARMVSVRLNEVDATRLHAHRKEYKHAMPVIVMAGVTALEEGANPEYSWFNRLMGATCRLAHEELDDTFFVEGVGFSIYVYSSYVFTVGKLYDCFYVCSPDIILPDKKGKKPCYAGTRHNCDAVATHLNKILRLAEEASNE